MTHRESSARLAVAFLQKGQEMNTMRAILVVVEYLLLVWVLTAVGAAVARAVGGEAAAELGFDIGLVVASGIMLGVVVLTARRFAL